MGVRINAGDLALGLSLTCSVVCRFLCLLTFLLTYNLACCCPWSCHTFVDTRNDQVRALLGLYSNEVSSINCCKYFFKVLSIQIDWVYMHDLIIMQLFLPWPVHGSRDGIKW